MNSNPLAKSVYLRHGSHASHQRSPESRDHGVLQNKKASRRAGSGSQSKTQSPGHPKTQQPAALFDDRSRVESFSAPFPFRDALRASSSKEGGRRRVTEAFTDTTTSQPGLQHSVQMADSSSQHVFHMPQHLREDKLHLRRQLFQDLQKGPSVFPSPQYEIPPDKINDPEVREWLLNYVRAIIDEAAACADVLRACYNPEDDSGQPGNLHKWNTKGAKGSMRKAAPVQLPIQMPTVKLVSTKEDAESETTPMTLSRQHSEKSPKLRFLSKIFGGGSQAVSRPTSVSQSMIEKTDSRYTKSKHSSWRTMSFFAQFVEKPRLDSLKDWSFSRIIVIDILRTRKQDLICSARHTFSGEWAILKIVWKRHFRSMKREIMRERKAWEALSDCQFIVGLKAFFSTSQCYVFVAEYYEGCTLQSLLEEGALREDVIVNIVANVTFALKYVHDRDRVYRNISLSTILVDMNGVARLFDFDTCSRGKTSSSRTGSIPYMAPEVLRMEVYDRTADYWSLGILTYVLHVRHTPMSIYSAKTNLDCWVDRDYMYQYAEVVPIVLPKHMPPHAKSLISGLLVERPCLRLGCRSTGFYEVMKHPFFHKVDWESFARKKGATHQNLPKGYQSLL